MMKKILCIFLPLVVLAAVLCGLAGCSQTGYTTYEGIYVRVEPACHVLIQGEERFLRLEDASKDLDLFDGLEPGDRIRISFVLIEEAAGLDFVKVYDCKKIGSAGESIAPEVTETILARLEGEGLK